MKPQFAKQTLRVGRRRRLLLYFIASGVWLSGGLWLLFHYFLPTKGEFGPQSSPAEAWWLRLHGAFAFASLWIFGLFWGIHVKPAWRYRKRRWSGGVLTGAFLVLALTGYLLYYVGDDAMRNGVSVMHWAIGLAAPAALLAHRWKRRRKRLAEQANTQELFKKGARL